MMLLINAFFKEKEACTRPMSRCLKIEFLFSVKMSLYVQDCNA